MDAVEKLTNLDLRFIVDQLAQQGIERERATQATEKYRLFLMAAARNPPTPLVPTKEVDAAWHTHMLNPLRYVTMCQEIFGHILDHDPTVYGTEAYERAWAETRALVAYGAEMPESPYGVKADGAACYLSQPAAVKAEGAACYLSQPVAVQAEGAACYLSQPTAVQAQGAACYLSRPVGTA